METMKELMAQGAAKSPYIPASVDTVVFSDHNNDLKVRATIAKVYSSGLLIVIGGGAVGDAWKQSFRYGKGELYRPSSMARSFYGK